MDVLYALDSIMSSQNTLEKDLGLTKAILNRCKDEIDVIYQTLSYGLPKDINPSAADEFFIALDEFYEKLATLRIKTSHLLTN